MILYLFLKSYFIIVGYLLILLMLVHVYIIYNSSEFNHLLYQCLTVGDYPFFIRIFHDRYYNRYYDSYYEYLL